jgi:hypothetical protein
MENIQNVIDQARQACKARKIADTQKEDDFEADETRPLLKNAQHMIA